MSYSYPEFLNYLPDASGMCVRLMHCNILSVTGMTLLVLPKMAENRRGLILNVSSFSAVLPTPLLTMYSSTKVHGLLFSKKKILFLLSCVFRLLSGSIYMHFPSVEWRP